MSKMKANFRKGSHGSKLLVMALLLTLLIAAIGSTAAFAVSTSFGINVAGASSGAPNRGQISVSLTETINLNSDAVFVGTNNMNRVYTLEIFSNNIRSDGSTPVKITKAENSKWSESKQTTSGIGVIPSEGYRSFIYKSRTPISKGTFDALMSELSLSFNSSSGENYGTGRLGIVAYYGTSANSVFLIKSPYRIYTCDFTFYNYAKGEANEESAVMDYKSDYAATYDSTYAQDVPDGQENPGILVESPDAAGGKAEFDLYLTEKGRGLQASVGYQIKKSSEAWTTSVTQEYVQEIESLSSWDINTPIHMSVEGLEAGETYDVRGMIATDGKTNTPKYTEDLSFCYRKPSVNSFNIGGVTTIYQGGKGLMNLSMLTTFNDQNAVGLEEYTGADGNTYSGPALMADIYFTPDRKFTTVVDEEGNESYGEDHSAWYQIPSCNTVKKMADSEGTVSTTFSNDWLNFHIPSNLQDLGVTGNTTPINSTTCAFKLVVTDLYTGYTAVSYSDPFTIDSGAPSKPAMAASSGGESKSLDLGNATVVGGTGEDGAAQVAIEIGNADDYGGSGIKQYSYSMYYLPTDSVPSGLSTTAQVLQRLSTYTPSTYDMGCDYKDWSPLSDKLGEDGTPVDNMTELIVSKDGYYRVIARAEDNAGFTSDTVEGYFRVDLTAPSAPVARLSKKESGTFKPYDNRTYTNSNVWAFAYSEPLTGKSLKTFKYSTDGGLTWTDIKDVNAAYKMVNLTNTSATVPAYSEGNYTSAQNFVYQVGLNLSGMGMNDYVSVLFKAVDTLGNESMVSNAAVMRTIADAPKATSVLEHEGIEVALALGNTEMITSRLTQDLKNQAAYKINEKYYGTSGSTTVGAADFNPWKYLLTLSHGSGRAGWKCTWGTDSSCTGACHSGTNCPYAKLQAMGYEMFTPEMVNVQGMSGASANNNSSFQWVRYDHTMFADVATAGYTSATVNRQAVTAAKPTNMEGNAKNPKDGLYISSKDRVIAMNQTGPATRSGSTLSFASKEVNKGGDKSYTDAYNAYGGYPGLIFAWETNVDVVGAINSDRWNYPTRTNIWMRGQQIRRIYHVMDLSYKSYTVTTQNSSGGTLSGKAYNQNEPLVAGEKLTTIGNAGYTTSAFRDWLFLYNDQPARKTIFFTVDDSTLVPHASDGYGFLFNTTIRQSKAGLGNSTIGVSDGSWRISGYLFYIGNQYIDRYTAEAAGTGSQHTEGAAGLSGYRWYVMKIDDVNMEHFADGSIRGAALDGTSGYGKKNAKEGSPRWAESPLGQLATDGSSHFDGLVRWLMYGGDRTEGLNGNYWISSSQAQGSALNNASAPGINYGITQLAMSKGDVNTTSYVRNFVIQTEGKQAKFYVYNSGECSNASSKKTSAQLINLFESQVTEENPTGASSYSAGYRLINWNTQDSSTYVTDEETGARQVGVFYTPRPNVDGIQIGKKDAKLSGVHADTNCYGFGPLFGARGWSHWCYADTRVEMSNIVMQVNVARKLSEVVNEPQWGTGKAKFIANISDDSTDDFQDPVLSAQVQWRLFTDKAKFMGWGEYDNRAATLAFIDRVEGDGTYISSETSSYDEITYTNQVAAAAEYITREYFEAFGFSATSSKPITQQVSEKIAGKGTVYSLDDINNINFSVSPEKYNTSSANPDYPSGRWYIVHDTTGYPNAGGMGRSETYSDALELKITEAGRYTIYFAPDATKVKNNTLDASDPTCVFDFIVNTPPVALFSGFVDTSGNITIEDSAYDPDAGVGPIAPGSAPNGSQNTYTYTDANGVKQTKSYNSIQLTGLTKTEWRWEILEKSGGKMYTVAQNGWSTTKPSGTLANLTNGHMTNDGKTLHSGATRLTTLPNGAALTVYQRVTDTSTHRVAKYSGGNFVGYEYQAAAGTVSAVNQQNLTSSTAVTYAPLSSFSMSSPIIYDTAPAGSTNSKIVITRQSRQTQKKNGYNVSWAIDLGDGAGYRQLTERISDHSFLMGSAVALKCVTAPSVDSGTGNASGVWELSKDFLKSKVSSGKSLTLQITETIQGLTQEDVNKGITTPHAITDSSARAIYYSQDKKAPSSQSVLARTLITTDGTDSEIEYEASNYLDVTNNDQFVVLHVNGSVDSEGAVAGYGYYFYDKAANGTETAWYKLDGSGKLTEITGSGTAAQKQKNALVKLGASGGTIRIGKNAMRKTPNDSLNIAIFAFDNQTGVTTGPTSTTPNLTGANETVRTKIEDIKLTVSRPMPPEISVTNMLNQNVAHISNANGFKDATGTDVQTTDLYGFSATNVTVRFDPKKDKYITNAYGELKKDPNGQEYYQDYYGQADLTGVANVRYTVRYKGREAQEWWTDEQLLANGMNKLPVNAIMPSAQTLTYTEDGVYEITAAVVNGSGTVSDTRTVKFTIDKTPPAGLEVRFVNEDGSDYVSNIWTRSVQIEASGATDTNADTAEYQYSNDGGKTWIKLGDLTQTRADVTFTRSGKYTVLVRAIDKAGNEMVHPRTMLVCIDNTPPVATKPVLTANSVMTDILTEYVVSLSFDDTAGKVVSIQGGETNELDREVAVPAGETVRFEFYPESGHVLGEVILDGQDVTDQIQHDEAKNVDYLTVKEVLKDASLSVTFPETELEGRVYRSLTRSMAAVQFAMARTVSGEEPESELTPLAEPGEEGDGSGETTEPDPGIDPDPEVLYNVKAYELDTHGTVTLSQNQLIPGGTVLLTMRPNAGYRVASLQINSEIIDVSTLNKLEHSSTRTYEVTVDRDNTEIFVGFERVPMRTLRLKVSDCGSAFVADNEGHVLDHGNGVYSVPEGEEVYIQMDAEIGYGVKNLLINGEQAEGFLTGMAIYQKAVSTFTGEGEDPGIDVEVIFDVLSAAKRTFQVSVGPSKEDNQTHGTIVAAGDAVNLPIGGARTFIITPEAGYKISHLYLRYLVDGDWDTEDMAASSDLKLMPGDIRRYQYTLKDPGSNGTLEAVFERQTYRITTEVSVGGDIGMKAADDSNLSSDAVPEGKDVLIIPLPKNGYRIQSITIFEMDGLVATNSYSIGAVSSYVLKNIHTNIRVQAEFVERTVDHIETTHSITAVANNVKDADDALADKPYQFRISDRRLSDPNNGKNLSYATNWSEWSESNTMTWTGSFTAGNGQEIEITPNGPYFIYLRARDRVGNVSNATINGIFALANMPGTLGAEALDDEGNYATKSVALSVNPNGNPEETEYRVYVSTSSSMTDMFIANADEPGGGWATLGEGNKFVIHGLLPGRWYHMQVVARNRNGHVTRLNSKDITSIMLSPAAPPPDSFYFEEQADPNAPVVLNWEAPTGEVKAVQIYRDGMFLVELNAETLSYEDARTNFPGDAVSKYSYAYVNAAGVGSSRMAISGEYYRANYGSNTNEEKAQKMDDLIALTEYEYLFSETMTYPSFHYGCKEPVSASTAGTENSGKITVQMNYDPNESGRYQKYFLTLKAFEKEVNAEGEPVLGEDGKPIYHEVDIEKWDPTKANREADGVTQKAQETKVTQVFGQTAARASWANLSTAYEYKIYVKEIRSNGAATSDNLGGQSQGVEYSLGKQYVVNRNGYYFEYTKDTTAPSLTTGSGTWTEEGLAAYTRYEEEGWDTPVNKNYITFNKSPSVELAAEADRYYDNGDGKVRTAGDGKPYLLVDQSMTDKTFHVNVAAWDPDGSREESSVKPAVNGTISTLPGAAPEITTPMPKSQEAASQRENLYPITFDASGLSTGVYTSMEMRASDSDTEATKTTDELRLVINRNTPSSSVIGGTSRQLENKASYSKGELVQVKAAAARDGAASTSLSKVALLVMPAEYQAALGSNDYNTLYQQLCVTGDAAAVAKARALLGAEASDSRYVTGGKLTEAGMNLAIVRVTPPVTKYVTITEEQYNARLAANGDKLLKDVGSKTIYWAELEYALSENICSWLKSGAGDTVIPDVELKATDRENTYMMKLVARFGGNTSSQTVDFVIKPEPSTEILTKKSFIWRDTSKAEYDYYVERGYTVTDIIDKYDECYDHDNITFEDPLPDSQNAYTTRVENGKTVYLVYKLVDSEGNVGNDYVSGEVRTRLGVHSQFDEVGVLLVTDSGYNPNTGAEFPTGYIDSPVYVNYNHVPVTADGDLKFGISGLSEGVTYYLWSYYKLPDRDRVYSKGHVALTTEDSFQMAQYGFTRSKYSYKEADYPDGRALSFNIGKLGSADASATVRVTPRYYQADEFGNLILADGNPIELTGEALAAARETFGFASGREYDTITFGDSSSKDAILRLQDTDKMQGHMVVRLMLTIESSDTGYCYVSNGANYTDVFIQDDESPVTSYILGVINKDENGEPFMTEVKNTSTGAIDRYEYQFSGLQVNYSQLSNLLLSYENLGTGDLENITAAVYDDREGLTPSTYFEAERPSETNLKQSLGGVGTVEIHPVSGLEDGVYEGWVFLSADHVEDPVKIKIRQVVGQSTLKGRIYITPEMPALNERTGVAKISLYDAETTVFNRDDGTFNVPPVYTTESKEYGGEFEIPNILNKGPYSGGKYYIVVERDGFLTYNGLKYRPRPTAYSLELGTTSKTYTFNLRLIGGDVNGDQKVNDTDLNILIEHYNRYTGLEGTSPEEEAIIKRCDFNQDGVVNALDRGFLIGNIGSTDESYPYRSFSPVQPDA